MKTEISVEQKKLYSEESGILKAGQLYISRTVYEFEIH